MFSENIVLELIQKVVA